MYQFTWAKRARGAHRLALVLGLAFLTLILAGLLSAMSERRALFRRRSETGDSLLLKKQGAVVHHESLLSRVPVEERHRAGARARRSIVQLASMLKCVSGCNPLSYRGYGCFCGYMGDGTPVDHIDSCCLEHDWCYSQSPCSKLSLYLLPYDWHCLTPGMAHCAHPSSLSPHAHCGQQLCQCDLEFANCVSRYPCPRRRVSCQHSKFAAFHGFLHGKKR